MPLQLNKLTVLGGARLSKPGYYREGGGLVLQLSPTGSKSWIFRYRRDGRIREFFRSSFRDWCAEAPGNALNEVVAAKRIMPLAHPVYAIELIQRTA